MLDRRRTVYICAALAGLALRLWFIVRFPLVQGDSLIYANIARTWLHHGVFGIGDGASVAATLIRLPGYPAFLASVFAVFGDNSFRAVMLLQTVIDLVSCWAIAELASEIVGEDLRARAHFWAFLLAALCPFIANYVALPLTETLSIATTVWALLFIVRWLKRAQADSKLIKCGAMCAAGCLLRPDNGIVVAVICGTILVVHLTKDPRSQSLILYLRAAAVVGVLAIVPLIPWTIRNWKTFHVLQPLAPRYANDPDEFVPHGFNRWVKTWIAEYVSTQEIYWQIDDSEHPADPENLPRRAFDSEAQRNRTYQLFYDVQSDGALTPEADARFAQLAQERVHAHPMRFYVALPVARIADMWLRPRIEMLPLEQRWWEFDDDRESLTATALGAINLGLIVVAIIGAFRFRSPVGWMLVGFVVVRSLFLGTLENPETRYTLECFPVVLAFAGAAVARLRRRRAESLPTSVG